MIAVDVAGRQASISGVQQIWRGKTVVCLEWQKGAIDAYNSRRPQSAGASYLCGYSEQLRLLPTDESGTIEWFRYRPDGGWKLTDNI